MVLGPFASAKLPAPVLLHWPLPLVMASMFTGAVPQVAYGPFASATGAWLTVTWISSEAMQPLASVTVSTKVVVPTRVAVGVALFALERPAAGDHT